ncbi:NO-inducible flavohemoprotein [Marinobacterium jannaschii]|uniref:NO-inducible flavohemoprotein n=1 Tax=Marinobacterium jannaschii TaxID=64970 RepID=UPI00047FC180|nr:NO-inducible flavohemoprotein [Marinobacterium jannaschii]
MRPETIAIVKQTVPLLEAHGVALTTHFYKLLFAENPELQHVFNMASQANGRQQSTLAASILAYAANIEKLQELGPMVNRIAAKHFSLDVQPEHYPIVGRNLLKAIREVAGEEVATDAVLEAWGEAYGALADILIGAEDSLYQEAADAEGGWRGFKPFNVVRKEVQSSEISSFYLQPEDGAPLPAFRGGQYISVKITPAEGAYEEIRQYSLSDCAGHDALRISVKREPAPAADLPAGTASNYLHDHISTGDSLLLHAPTGDFCLADESEAPVVLISGGVGVTPLLSMLNELVMQGKSRQVNWIHGTRNRDTHAFAAHIRSLSADLDWLDSKVFYENGDNATEGTDYDQLGYIDLATLQSCPAEAEFYYCGPQPFMAAIEKLLDQCDIPAARRHSEVFGPSEERTSNPA